MLRLITKFIVFLFIVFSLDSCISVKAYEKMYLNDSDMKLEARKIQVPEQYAQGYREASSGANGAKSGGGCGCN